MKFWYFKYEGEFKENSSHFGEGVFSGCLIPDSNFQRAKSLFLKNLSEHSIRLVEIIEHFSLDGRELDPSDETNTFWIEWYERAEESKQVENDSWHVFGLEK